MCTFSPCWVLSWPARQTSFYCTSQILYCVWHQLKVCGNLAWASLLAPFFQEHLLTLCLSVTLWWFSLYFKASTRRNIYDLLKAQMMVNIFQPYTILKMGYVHGFCRLNAAARWKDYSVNTISKCTKRPKKCRVTHFIATLALMPWSGMEPAISPRLACIKLLLFPKTKYGEGNGTPLQHPCLENPTDGGAWWTAVQRVAQSRTRLKRLSSSSSKTK